MYEIGARKRLLLTGICVAATVAALSGTAAPSFADAPIGAASAFVVVDGHEPLHQNTALGTLAGFNSEDTYDPASVIHAAAGKYEVIFPGLGTLNGGLTSNWEAAGVQVRSVGKGGNCRPEPARYTHELDTNVPKDSLGIKVDCFNGLGNFSDLSFAISDSYGPIGNGSLVNAILPGQDLTPMGTTQVVNDLRSSVGGTATYVRTGVGSYTATVPYVGGTGPLDLAVTAEDSGDIYSDVTCGADSPDTPYLKDGRYVIDVSVSCALPAFGLNRDAQVSISYTRGTTLVGATSNNLADANLKAPKLTTNTTIALTPNQLYSSVYDIHSAATVTRTDTGTYTVDLAHQAWSIGSKTVFATATAPGAYCLTSNPVDLADASTSELTVTCHGQDGNDGTPPADTGFYLSYMARQ